MATVEFLTKRVEGKEKEIDKLQKKLERIEKAESTGWEVNPYYYSENDKRWTARDLEEAKASLEKYKAELIKAQEKEQSRNVPAILEFLENWKARVREFYGEGLKAYYEEREKVYQMYLASGDYRKSYEEREELRAKYEEASKAFREKCYGTYERYEYTRGGRTFHSECKVKDGEYEYLKPYSDAKNIEFAMEKLNKDLEAEANRKYDFIIERTNQIVGKITDASGLKVGHKQDLNGFIKGEKATAKVQTIGAGGYNIQCFHFRTLINEVR